MRKRSEGKIKYKKSFARLFDPSTFIEDEQNISREDYAEGVEAQHLFIKRAKRVDRLLEMGKASPFLKFITKCNDNHVVPCPMGMISTRKNPQRNDLNAEGYRMGDIYAEALGKGLKLTNRPLRVVRMAGNRLSTKGAGPLINTLSPELTELDLSRNPLIGQKSYMQLG